MPPGKDCRLPGRRFRNGSSPPRLTEAATCAFRAKRRWRAPPPGWAACRRNLFPSDPSVNPAQGPSCPGFPSPARSGFPFRPPCSQRSVFHFRTRTSPRRARSGLMLRAAGVLDLPSRPFPNGRTEKNRPLHPQDDLVVHGLSKESPVQETGTRRAFLRAPAGAIS